MNILCVCPIGIGNYLLCYPAFAALRKEMPQARLHLLALREGITDIARSDVIFSGVTTFDPTKIGRDPRRVLKIISGLREKRFDASLNFFPSNTWQYHLLPVLSGIPKRYGFRYHVAGPSKLRFLCNYALPVDERLHDVDQNKRLISFFLGKEIMASPPEFPTLFSDTDRKWAQEFIAANSANAVRIGVHPGSSVEHGMDAKRWSPLKFAQLADKAGTYLKAQVYIFGGPDEVEIMREVSSAMRCPSHVVEKVSLAKTAALLSMCSLCVCNDSGLMHIAACSGVPTAGIFGPTDETRNGPFGKNNLVIRKSMRGFPVWTARTVGDRSVPKGIDPMESLKKLEADEAWVQLKPWIEAILQSQVYLTVENRNA